MGDRGVIDRERSVFGGDRRLECREGLVFLGFVGVDGVLDGNGWMWVVGEVWYGEKEQ